MTSKLKKYIILIPILFGLLASHRLFRPGYFSMQDDMHIFRLSQLHQCLIDGQIPCRLIADGGLGYSYPLYNFYSPLPYLFAEVFHLAGISLIDSLKISFIFPYFIGSIGMFLLSKKIFGTAGAVISTALFTLAPYHSLDGFVRGALAEHWAINIMPFVIYGLISKRSNVFVVSFLALSLSHNLTLIYTLPLILLFSIISKNIKFLVVNGFIALLISSFFILPAFFEKNLTTVDTMTQGYFNYIIHFATINQLFISRFWGYGASLWGPVDDLSFQIGHPLWIVAILAIIHLLKNKSAKHFHLLVSVFGVGLLSIFLTHNRSTFIWQLLPFLAYYQFPWRFLGLSVFCLSLVSGAVTKNYYLVILLVSLTIFLNIGYFKEDIWYPSLTDNDRLTTAEIYRQSGAGVKDYWPKNSTEFPTQMADPLPIVVSGEVTDQKFIKNSKQANGTITNSSDTTINLPITYFPNWVLTIDGHNSNYTVDKKYGQIQLFFPAGTHSYQLTFANTPIRTLANILSLIGLLIYIIKVYREAKS
jgi:hypothetical protein